MLNNFRNWYLTNFTAINWFLIGAFTAFGIDDLVAGNYPGAALDFIIAYVNFLFRDRI
jgi:hypothetical protein